MLTEPGGSAGGGEGSCEGCDRRRGDGCGSGLVSGVFAVGEEDYRVEDNEDENGASDEAHEGGAGVLTGG